MCLLIGQGANFNPVCRTTRKVLSQPSMSTAPPVPGLTKRSAGLVPDDPPATTCLK